MICNNCGAIRSKEDFYSKDRTCKVCRRDMASKNRANNLGRVQEYDRARGRTIERINKNKDYVSKMKQDQPDQWRNMRYEATLKYRTKHKDRQRARAIVNNLIRSKKLTKGPCNICGALKVQAHHKDYSKPLEITWLCDKHHKEVHIKERENLRTNTPSK